MTRPSLRQALLITTILGPATAVVVAALSQNWQVASVTAALLITAVGAQTLMALSEIRAVRRRSDQQAKRLRDIAMATSTLAALHAHVGTITATTHATLARADSTKRLIEDLSNSILNEFSTASDRSRDTLLHQQKFHHELQNVQRALSDHTTGAVNNAANRTVSRLTSIARDETRQVEALIQLIPQIKPVAPLPPSGKWALDARSLLHLNHLCRTLQPKRVLELGGGTSTVWLAHILQDDTFIASVDHDATWARLTNESLKLHGLADRVSMRIAPLEAVTFGSETFDWYQLDAFADLEEVDLLLIDGPPQASGRFARYPALPALHKHLSASCTVLLDDAERPDEIRAIERWLEEFKGFTRTDEGVSRLAVLRRTL